MRRVAVEDLPISPIAFLHWEDKPARKRGEAFGSRAELPVPPPDKIDPEGAEEREILAYLRAEHSAMLSLKVAKHPGRLMVYWPARDEVERVDAAPVNSRPLAWSPDHRRLLFVSAHRDQRQQLYEYDFDQRHLTTLTFGSVEHVRGDYDEKGRIVVLRKASSQRMGRSDRTIHMASAGGQIGPELAEGIYPGTLRVLPKGDRIVYEQVRARPRRDGPTSFESFVAIQALGSGEEKILIRGREPSLTPDGEWIVFASESSAGYRLRRMRPDGTSRVAVTSGPTTSSPVGTEERMPTVSPDGAFVAFIKDAGNSRRLYVRRFDGKRERALVLSGWSEFPVW